MRFVTSIKIDKKIENYLPIENLLRNHIFIRELRFEVHLLVHLLRSVTFFVSIARQGILNVDGTSTFRKAYSDMPYTCHIVLRKPTAMDCPIPYIYHVWLCFRLV